MRSHTLDGAEVRRLRESKGLSVEGLATTVGITTDYLYKLEGLRKQPSAPVAGRLATALGVEPEQILLARPVEQVA